MSMRAAWTTQQGLACLTPYDRTFVASAGCDKPTCLSGAYEFPSLWNPYVPSRYGLNVVHFRGEIETVGVILFLAVTVIGGILFIINGVSVLLGDCAAVTFDDSRRLTGRSFLIRATCLDEQQASSSDVPTWMGGWGLIVVGLLSVTAFLWLLPILARLAQRKEAKRIQREELMMMNRLNHQERMEAFYYGEEARLANTRQAKASKKGLGPEEIVQTAKVRCTSLRIGTTVGATLAAVVSFFAIPSGSVFGATAALLILGLSVGMMAWAVLLKARYIGKARKVWPDVVYSWLALSLGGGAALAFSLAAFFAD